MDTPASNATRLIRPALRSIVFCFSIIVIAMTTMAKPAQASGTVSSGSLASAASCINYPISSNATMAAFLACTAAAAGGVSAALNGGENCCIYAIIGYAPGQCTNGGCIWGYAITYTTGCPANSKVTGTNTCTCNDPYVPDSTQTSCVLTACPANMSGVPCVCKTGYVPNPNGAGCIEEQYTLSVLQDPLPDVEPGASASPYVEVVNAQTQQPKEGAVVNIKVEVDASSGGHDHGESIVKRNKGTLSGCSAGAVPGTIDCTTGPNGRASFNFGAPDASGTHTFTATCISHACSGSKTSEINVKVNGLAPIPSEPSIYALIGGEADKKHHDNHYLTDNALSQLVVLAINYHFLYPNEPVLHLNDASLVWGGKFDIKGNWVGDHGAHRRGTVIDIRANTTSGNIPERLFTDFEDMAANTKLADGGTSANAELHCSSGRDPAVDNCVGDDNRHYHVILLGVDQ